MINRSETDREPLYRKDQPFTNFESLFKITSIRLFYTQDDDKLNLSIFITRASPNNTALRPTNEETIRY